MALSTTRTLLTQTGINTHQVLNVGGLDSAGIATFSNFKTGSSNLHSTGLTVGDTFLHSTGVNLGTGATVSNNGNATFSGIITASSFVGDISNATGAAAGLGTALSQTQTDPLNKIYFTNKVLSISTTTTIDHPATANLAYTQYGDIKIEDGHDLIIKDGDDFKYDVLGISTTKIFDIIGNVTGDVTGNLTGNVTGNVTGTASSLSGNPSINTTGTITATSFSGDGGSITGVNSPVFYGKQGTSQNVAHATYTTITNLTSTSINVGGGFDTASGVFTVPAGKGGTYFLHGGAGIDDVQNNDYVQVTFMKNGSRTGPYARTWSPDANDQIIDANLTTIMNLSAGDTVNFQVYHTGNATEPTEENRCFFGGYRLSV
jgi:hypothetical protein